MSIMAEVIDHTGEASSHRFETAPRIGEKIAIPADIGYSMWTVIDVIHYAVRGDDMQMSIRVVPAGYPQKPLQN